MQNSILENQNNKQENQNPVLEIWKPLLNNKNNIWKNKYIVLEKQTNIQLTRTHGRDRMEDDRVRRRSQLNVKSCVLCVLHTSVLAAICVSSQ